MDEVIAVQPSIPSLIGVLISVHAMVTDNYARRSLVTLDAVHGMQDSDMVLAMLVHKGGIGFLADSPMRYLIGIRNVHLPARCKGLSYN